MPARLTPCGAGSATGVVVTSYSAGWWAQAARRNGIVRLSSGIFFMRDWDLGLRVRD